MKCVIYTRVEFNEVESRAETIVGQTEECSAYVKRNCDLLFDKFEDIRESNRNFKREGLQSMLAFCRKNRVDYIVASDPSRLAANKESLAELRSLLKPWGTKIKFVHPDNGL